jgi:hypothetical protein
MIINTYFLTTAEGTNLAIRGGKGICRRTALVAIEAGTLDVILVQKPDGEEGKVQGNVLLLLRLLRLLLLLRRFGPFRAETSVICFLQSSVPLATVFQL